MKANLTFLLASFVTLATAAHATSLESPRDLPIVLPKVVITAPHATPVEQRINASLLALQQQANAVSLLTSLDAIAPEISASTPRTAEVGVPTRASDSKS